MVLQSHCLLPAFLDLHRMHEVAWSWASLPIPWVTALGIRLRACDPPQLSRQLRLADRKVALCKFWVLSHR